LVRPLEFLQKQGHNEGSIKQQNIHRVH
jgi:hypothetical protein